MKNPPVKSLLLAILVSGIALAAVDRLGADEGLSPAYLRVENRIRAFGIDVRQPRLSWIVTANGRGQKQTAYRVLVASDSETLAADRGDLWDTGRVASSKTTSIVYGGKPLTSRRHCYWKVKVWDRDGVESSWSPTAQWSMGLLDRSDWLAEWIGYDQPLAALEEQGGAPPHPITRASWIWFPETGANPASAAPPGKRYFRREFTIPSSRKVQAAQGAFAADNGGILYVNGTRAGAIHGFQTANQLEIAPYLHPGKNFLAVAATNAGEKPNPAGLIGALRIEFDQGEPLILLTDDKWLASKTAQAGWNETSPADADWSSAVVLKDNLPWPPTKVSSLRLPPPRYLRQNFFALNRPIRRATLYATALGLVEMHLNGERVGDDYFTPGWTDYERRVYYRAYDVTKRISPGPNTLGGILADGWYAGYVGYGGGRDLYGDKIRLRAQLEIEFADGTRQTIATGPKWTAKTGPLQYADFLMGERYDARRAMPGWDRAGPTAGDWQPVDVTPAAEIAAQVQAAPGPPVRALPAIEPVEIIEPRAGVYVVNLGQNFAGFVKLRVHGSPGQTITLRHAERLQPNGMVYTENLRSARATDSYICSGKETDATWWHPRFTFHGFQYVEVTGLGRPLQKKDLLGIPLSSDTPVVGSFSCSNPLVNKLFSNIYWTQRMNFIDIPTDCPQRDERLGWTGDAQIYVRTAAMLTDVEAFFTKWLVDLTDAQRADGQFPMVAPLKSKGPTADGGPAWADAGIICPLAIYDVYGDRRLLEQHYDAMARFIDFCQQRSTAELLPPKKFHCFGDWLSIRADTPKEVIYTAYFAHSTRLMARAAEALGKQQDADRYRRLFEKIKAAFNQAYIDADGRIQGDTQTDYVLALAFDLVDGKRRQQAAQHLVDNIRDRDWCLSTGFIGTKDLMLALNKIGRQDVAYRLLLNTKFPSWGFSIQQGATTIWERWNGWTPEKGFFDPGMNSFAHYSFGAVGQWMFETIGGIQLATPGFGRIVIAPQPGGDLTWAKVGYNSVHGLIATDWKIGDGMFTLRVTIPANTTAEIHVPTRDESSVVESGRPIAQAVGVERLRREGDTIVYGVGSGEYMFQAKYP